MLARYLLSSCVRLSVCSSVTKLYRNRARFFWHGGFLPPIPHCVIRKFRYLPKLRYFSLELCPKLRTFENFATASRSRCQQNSSSLSSTIEFTRQSTSRGCLLQLGQLQPSDSIRSVLDLSYNLFLHLTTF